MLVTVTPTHLYSLCLARQVGLCRLSVTPMYLDNWTLMVTLGARVAIGDIGPPSSPGIASTPVILVPGHLSGQSSLVNIVSQCLLAFLVFTFNHTADVCL